MRRVDAEGIDAPKSEQDDNNSFTNLDELEYVPLQYVSILAADFANFYSLQICDSSMV
jgi:hypothetical protein